MFHATNLSAISGRSRRVLLKLDSARSSTVISSRAVSARWIHSRRLIQRQSPSSISRRGGTPANPIDEKARDATREVISSGRAARCEFALTHSRTRSHFPEANKNHSTARGTFRAKEEESREREIEISNAFRSCSSHRALFSLSLPLSLSLFLSLSLSLSKMQVDAPAT